MTHYIFDCDDVLLDWMGGFVNWLPCKPDPAGPTEWDMAAWLHTSPHYARKLVMDFNMSFHFSCLNAMPGAYEKVWQLRGMGHTTSVLTACGDHYPTKQHRRHNLSNEFDKPKMGAIDFAFDSTAILPLGSKKFDYLYNFVRSRDPSTVVMVEDHFAHAQAAAVNGIKSYCIRKGHNRADEGKDLSSQVIWINDISEVV